MRIRDKFRPRASMQRQSSFISGRLQVRTATDSIDSDNLTLQDSARCRWLLEKYRRLIETGEICSGNCADGGVGCSSGICRAHLRY